MDTEWPWAIIFWHDMPETAIARGHPVSMGFFKHTLPFAL